MSALRRSAWKVSSIIKFELFLTYDGVVKLSSDDYWSVLPVLSISSTRRRQTRGWSDRRPYWWVIKLSENCQNQKQTSLCSIIELGRFLTWTGGCVWPSKAPLCPNDLRKWLSTVWRPPPPWFFFVRSTTFCFIFSWWWCWPGWWAGLRTIVDVLIGWTCSKVIF